MDKEIYLSDPCGASSLPFWKTNHIHIPEDMLILREDAPRLEAASLTYEGTPYFKLLHPMTQVDRPKLPDGFHFVCPDETILSYHIATCYEDIGVTPDELTAYRLHPTFSPDLWLAIVEEKTDTIVASGIAELDRDIREGILEWVQVTPAYRRRGWGNLLVRELLYRMQGQADFVTVSGKESDPSNPRALYERCGFGNGVVWHILHTHRPI